MKTNFFSTAIFSRLFPVLALFLLASCNSVPKNIPFDMTAAELTQAAQTAYDNSNIAGANAYYQTIIERFGNDPAVRIPAEYEIAHILVKKHRWNEARPMLEKIIADFAKAPISARLPREYLKLAHIDMAKMPS